MKENDLEKRAEELEKTLEYQIQQLKRDSGVWLKVGGAILVFGLLSFGVTKAIRNKKNKQKIKLDKVEPEERWEERRERRERRKPAKKSSFFSSLKKRLFLTLLSYGEVKLMDELKKRTRKDEN